MPSQKHNLNSPAGLAWRSSRAELLTWVMIGLLGVLMLWPLGVAVRSAFVDSEGQFSLVWFKGLCDQQTYRQLCNGVELATCTTLICFVLGLPLALLRARRRFLGQGFFSIAILVPLILPPFVGAVAMRQLLGRFGTLNIFLHKLGLVEFSAANLPPNWLEGGFWAVAAIQALHLFPILYLNASAALANIDPSYADAARNLGAGRWTTFFRVTLPQMRPGLFAGGTLVFIWSFTDLGTPLMLNYNELLPVRIFGDLAGGDYSGNTFARVVVLLALSVGLYVVGKYLFGRGASAAGGKATTQAKPKALSPKATLGAWLLFGGILLLSLLPHIGVVVNSFAGSWINSLAPSSWTSEHYRTVISEPDTYSSIVNSLQYAGCSTVLDLLLGGVCAWLIVRTTARGRAILDAVVMLPLAVPGLILAAGYVAVTAPGSSLLQFSQWAFDTDISPRGNPFVLLVIAYTVRRLPFVVRGVGAGLQQIPVSLEEAACNLGATPSRAIRRITIPLLAANLIAAGVLVFSFAMLEVSDSLVLAQEAENYPITKQIYSLYMSGTLDSTNVAAALGVCGMLLLGGTMALASLLLGKRLGAIFRA